VFLVSVALVDLSFVLVMMLDFEYWFSLYCHFCPPTTCPFPPPASFLVGYKLVAVLMFLVGGCLFDVGSFFWIWFRLFPPCRKQFCVF